MIDAPDAHECRFRNQVEWLEWTQVGRLQERQGQTRAVCADCERVRPPRRPLPPDLLEREATGSAGIALGPHVRAVAQLIARRSRGTPQRPLRYAGILGSGNRLGVPASDVDTAIEQLLHAGCLSTRARRKGSGWELTQLKVRRPDHLEDILAPGSRANRIATLDQARQATCQLTHPVAAEVSRLLAASSADRLDERVVRALAAVAAHAETGEVLSANVFSAQYLGSAKALRQVRGRLERLIGELAGLGIREGAAVLLLGGRGSLRRSDAAALELGSWHPFLGVAREIAPTLSLDFPRDGLVIVENLAVFEACCRGEVRDAGDSLFVWSSGYPGRAVRAVVDGARAANVAVRVWADLDLDGIRIARLVHSWAPQQFRPFRMSPEDVATSSITQAIEARALARIDADLVANPRLPLAETLQALRQRGRWIEQETLLGAR